MPAGLELGQVFKKADRRLAAAHLPQLAGQAQLIVAQRERIDGDAVEPAQRHVANGSGDLAGEVELGHLAKRHRLAGVEKNGDGQLALLLVKLEEKSVEAAVEIPVEAAQVVAGDVVAVVGELDRLAARAAAALAL